MSDKSDGLSSRSSGRVASRRVILTGGVAGAAAGLALGSATPALATPTLPTPDWLNVTDPASNPGGLSADPTGVNDSAAAINAVLAAAGGGTNGGSGVVYLPPGTYLINAPLVFPAKPAPDYHNQCYVTLLGAGPQLTTIVQGSAFTGLQLVQLPGNSTVSDLCIQGAASLPPVADGIFITQSGTWLEYVTLRNLKFDGINGWCIHLKDDKSPGAPRGLVFDSVKGRGAGGCFIEGGKRTLGEMRIVNGGLNAIGGTSTTLDALCIQDAEDIENINNLYAIQSPPPSGSLTGHAIHLVGNVVNCRFAFGEYNADYAVPIPTGRNSACIKIEDSWDTSAPTSWKSTGAPSKILFESMYLQQADVLADLGSTINTTTGQVLTGSCSDIFFHNCEFNRSNTHGTTVNTSQNGIRFVSCRWGSSGQVAKSTTSSPYFDLNWSGSGGGDVIDCAFLSDIVNAGVNGVQTSINIAAKGQDVRVMNPRFNSATGSAASGPGNQLTNFPSIAEIPLASGLSQLSGGSLTISNAMVSANTAYPSRIGIRPSASVGTPGIMYVANVVNGAFTVKSNNTSDNSWFEWTVYSGG